MRKHSPYRKLGILVAQLLFCVGCVTMVTPMQEMLQHLQADIQKVHPESTYRVAIIPIVFQDTNLSSPLSRWLEEEVSSALGKTAFFEEFPRENLQRAVNELKRTRSTLFDPETRKEFGKLKGIHGFLNGRYWPTEQGITLHLDVLSVESGQKWTCKGEIARPPSLAVEPTELSAPVVHKVLNEFSVVQKSEFGLEVWVDKADYGVGEPLTVSFSAAEDCYWKLYCINAQGEVQLIFPRTKEQKLQRAGEKAQVSFEVAGPLGTDLIKAVASTEPFPEIEEAFTTIGLDQAVAKQNRGDKSLRPLEKQAERTLLYKIR